MYITAVMLLLPVEKHSQAYLHAQVGMPVAPQSHHELKVLLRFYSGLTIILVSRVTVFWGRHTWVQILVLLLANKFRDRLSNPFNFDVHIYKMEMMLLSS